MQPASDSTVLGDFSDASFVHAGVTSRFFRRDGRFMVRTDGPDGALHEYEIKYTFGVFPLQQYLVEFPGGRLQALGIAWDSRLRDRGGQRWFHLYPDRKLAPSDPLHWTGPDQNWNFMCADCHSTNVRKNYYSRTRSFATSYAEIDVACEACHGPGSNHVAWAKKQADWQRFDANHGLSIALDERRTAAWTIDPATGNARRGEPRRSEREIQMCARCHSRRSQIHEDYVHGEPVGDDYRISLLEEPLYFPDGQMKDEVYEYGSFIQSRMFHAGVTCSDCHEPHSLKLRAEGNGACAQCHFAPKYDSPKHHFHPAGSAGARCVECHMPTRTYMVVDPRRDHSIRIPRPELTLKLGVPNACNGCHSGKSARWAAETAEKWYGHAPIGYQRFGEVLRAGQLGAPGAEKSLAELVANSEQPAIARAYALELIAGSPGPLIAAAVRDGTVDSEPLVRRASARAMSEAEPIARAALLAPLLCDPVRDVRLEAAAILAGVGPDMLTESQAAALRDASAEYIAAQRLNSDRPEAHLNLALLDEAQHRADEAEAELEVATAIDPSFAPAAVNLADLYRESGHDGAGERVLRDAIAASPNDASLQHALGLLLVRQARGLEALAHLAEAARLAPGDARFAYVYAIALDDAGRRDEAIVELEAEIGKHPYDRDALAALASIYSKAENPRRGLPYAARLVEIEPHEPQARQLMDQLRAAAHERAQ